TSRFGQPRTTCPSTINARHTAYRPPRKNPFVPSMGSSVHQPMSNMSIASSSQVIGDARPMRLPDHSHGKPRPGVPQGSAPDWDRVPSARTRRFLDRP
ncbi:hypothetical protein HD554DRAFT_2020949, partial [Boletus coccyginus]